MVSREHIEKTGQICDWYIQVYNAYRRDLTKEYENLRTISLNAIREIDERKKDYMDQALLVVEEETHNSGEDELFEWYLEKLDGARLEGMPMDLYLKRKDVMGLGKFRFKSFIERENYEYEHAYPYGWKEYLKDKISGLGRMEKYRIREYYEAQKSDYEWHLTHLKAKAIELAQYEMKEYLRAAGVSPKEAHPIMVNRSSIMEDQIVDRIEVESA